ncbi:MAG: serpin family protein [Polyangiaceae bacterium]|nr:serpin family protein [Polyangiaceae bacterium]
MRSSADAASNTFTLAAYAVVAKKEGNVLLSGTSIRSALGLAYLGARGATRSEMGRVLGFEAGVDVRAEADLLRAAAGAAELAIANRLWPHRGLTLEPDYRSAMEAQGASLEALDFARGPNDARESINASVAKDTAGKIENLLPPGSIGPLTRLVLTNALYFKGKWDQVFPKEQTQRLGFYVAPDRPVISPMMRVTADLHYGEVGSAKLLQLAYRGSDLAMLVALPKDQGGLHRLEDGLSWSRFQAWTQVLQRTKVQVFLPRFTFRQGGSVKPVLMELGLAHAFGAADFSGIAGPPGDLYLDDVFHDTFVAVDEEGTEAAAATGAVVQTRGRPAPIPVFRADHPFLFFMRDTRSGRIVFAGRLANPEG